MNLAEHWPTPSEEDLRQEIIHDCLVSLYIRFRKAKPSQKDMELEVSLASKDFEKIPTNKLKDFFANAYEKHDGKFIPTNKEMLLYWKGKQAAIVLGEEKPPCANCNTTGFISAKIDVDGRKNTYAFRCTCLNGQRMSAKIRVWDEQCKYDGFERLY